MATIPLIEPFARLFRRELPLSEVAYFLATLTIFSPIPEVIGKDPPSLQEKRECAEQMRERAAAINMHDWPQLDRITRRFVQSCNGVYDRRAIADAFGDIADANNEMGRFEEALAQANAGIASHYLATSSHLEKVRALFALDRITEAQESFRVADHVIHLAIQRTNDELQNDQSSSDRESHLAESTLVQSQLKVLDNYRSLLGNK